MSHESAATDRSPLTTTGVAGLDDILGGGLTRDRLYLLEGNPGAGKTTLALQYLLHGAGRGEVGVYVTLSETKAELIAVAASHGWSLDAIHIIDLVASESELDPDNQLAMFQPSEVELGSTTKAILREIERVKPKRVVVDSLSELRLLAQGSLRYRRQILALKQYFIGRNCTVLLLDDLTSEASDLHLQSIAHGVLTLEQLAPEFGAERRRLRVAKLRGQQYRGGYHDFLIEPGGLRIFPRMVAAEHEGIPKGGQLKSGIAGLDELVGGGFECGTSVLVAGPAGIGKSSLALRYAKTAADRGGRAAIFAFEERTEIILGRSAGLGMDLRPAIEAGRVTIQQVDPGELSPGEFAHAVRAAAEGRGGLPPADVVIIDSLNGYLNAMPEERFLVIQLHELLTYLGHKGVVTFLVLAQHGLIGSKMESPVDTTYLADSVILLRYFEAAGEVRQAVSVVKKRSGRHERTIREFRMGSDGLRVGEPLREFHGILSGTPLYGGAEGRVPRPADD
jgi:circadian clock protein KaiC